MRHSSEIDMCSGPLAGSLLRFSIPLMASSILQLLFNAADIIVLGQFASSSAMAAVGATSSLNSLMVNLFLGLSIGCSVVMARSYGAQDWQRVHDTVHTALLLAVCCGAVLILAGVPLLPALLRWMDTPPDLLDQSVLYMRIVFLGMPAMMIYDFGAGILRAIGDTQRPLFFLTAAGVTNACLNVFFVVAFHLDVAGVALATSLSQYLSAFLVVRCLMQPDTRYQLRLRELKISAPILLQIVRVGLPAGIQSVVFSISNVLIQSSINTFGTLAVAGSTAAANIENFVYTAMNAIYQAALNFTSQNVGAGRPDRVRRGMKFGVVASALLAEGVGVGMYLLAPWLIGAFNSEAAVIAFGVRQARTVALFYCLLAFSHCCAGILRGLGRPMVPMAVMLAVWCALRITYITVTLRFIPQIGVIFWAYPITWTISSVIFAWYLAHCPLPSPGGGAPLHKEHV